KLYTRLLQAKHYHYQNREITLEDLLDKKSVSRFGLKKYFESYMKIRNNFVKELELILCTNISLKFEQNSHIPLILKRKDRSSYPNVNLYFEPSPGDD